MRGIIILLILIAVSLYSQFSSNIDYEETTRIKDQVGVNYSFMNKEAEWDFNDLNVDYNVFISSINLKGMNNYKGHQIEYSAGYSSNDYDYTTKIDTLYPALIYNNDNSISFIEVELGINDIEGSYGIKVRPRFIENNYLNENDKQFNSIFSGFYSFGKEKHKYGMSIEYSLLPNDSILKYAGLSGSIPPSLKCGPYYSYNSDITNFKTGLDLYLYDNDFYTDDTCFGIYAAHTIKLRTINSEIYGKAGMNMNKEFELAGSQLPFFYYTISVKNYLFSEKLVLDVGWSYDQTRSKLNDHVILHSILPITVKNNDTVEDMITNRLFVSLSYLY